MYKLGTIKLTWADTTNHKILNSKMFGSVEDALKFTEGKNNWLIFRLTKVIGDNYTWEMLPYGASRKYLGCMKVDSKPILKYAGVVLMAFGAYMLVRYTYNRVTALKA